MVTALKKIAAIACCAAVSITCGCGISGSTSAQTSSSQKSAAASSGLDRSKYTVAIDAGHQKHGNYGYEKIGPDTNVTKYKMDTGATGVVTHWTESRLNLKVARQLKTVLEKKGYKVYMVRNSQKYNKSCKQRALMVNKSGADICIRIHADSVDVSSVHGASALYKPNSNSYYSSKDASKSKFLSRSILHYMCKNTGAYSRGLSRRTDLTGNNWSKVPVSLIEVGFMSNPSEDRTMIKTSYQIKVAAGLAKGIDHYFAHYE